MYKSNLVLLLSFTAAVVASPAPTALEDRNIINCKVIGALADLKPLGAKATSFCSSYLHIPTPITQTVTAAAATVYVLLPLLFSGMS
jgi:hypothetical protein